MRQKRAITSLFFYSNAKKSHGKVRKGYLRYFANMGMIEIAGISPRTISLERLKYLKIA